MFDVYWSDKPLKTVEDRKEQAAAQEKERARQRPLSRPSFFKQLNAKRQDVAQKSRRNSSTLSIPDSNRSTQVLSIASSDDHLPAQELPVYPSDEPQELPASEKHTAAPLQGLANLEYKKDDVQAHSPSTDSLASSAGWLNNPNTPNSSSPTSPIISTSQREPQSGYHGIASPIQHLIRRKPTRANTIRRKQSLPTPEGIECQTVSASSPTTSHFSRCSNPTILESSPLPNITTTQIRTLQMISQSTFPAPIQESQSGEETQIQNCKEENEVGALGLPENRPGYNLTPEIVSLDVEVPSHARIPVFTSNSKFKAAETSPALATSSQRRLNYMKSASQKVTLQRLQEIWDNTLDDVFEEVEAEKEWWLYMAYEKLRKEAGQISEPVWAIEGKKSPESGTEAQNVLFLYHSQPLRPELVAVDFLTTFTSTTQFHHLCPPATGTGATTISLPSQNFHLIHLPITISSLLPASSFPLLLQECARILSASSSSSLHLTISNPCPLSQTMGPLLQHWLTTNLLLNLEINFRCLNPGRLIPLWLEKAGLRVERQCLARRFLGTRANNQNQGVETGDKAAIELEVEVGRRLWWMVWGSFVQGGVRWWDNEDIVKECGRMGTVWECLEIKSILL